MRNRSRLYYGGSVKMRSLGARIMKLPAMIVGVMVHLGDRLAAAQDVNRGEGGATRGLVERPRIGQFRAAAQVTHVPMPNGHRQRREPAAEKQSYRDRAKRLAPIHCTVRFGVIRGRHATVPRR